MITPELTKMNDDHLAEVVERQKVMELRRDDLDLRDKQIAKLIADLHAERKTWESDRVALAEHVNALHTIQQFPRALNELCGGSVPAAPAETHD